MKPEVAFRKALFYFDKLTQEWQSGIFLESRDV